MDPDIAIVPLVTALMLAVKQAPPLKREGLKWLLPWIAVALGVGVSLLAAGEVTTDLALRGLVYGLAAAGLYDGTVGAGKRLKGAKGR
ncbi:MAG: hypothetical protein R6X20_02370 [Phycisphaerae bacterium]